MKTETIRIWEKTEYTYQDAFEFVPKLTTYLHEDEEKRPCILVVPGGGYSLVSPKEGEPVAKKFYGMGYQTFVLTYTTNFRKVAPLRKQPLNDISRAVRLIRRQAEEFRVDEGRLALCGFSSGGHLCGSLCVHHEDVLEENTDYQVYSNRPDGAILAYPVITSGEKAHRDTFTALFGQEPTAEELDYMSLETKVTDQTPPCFLWTTAGDMLVHPENAVLFAKACFEKKVPVAFHLFSEGRHGLSLADDDWANDTPLPGYTSEQFDNMMQGVHAGELTLPQECVESMEKWDRLHKMGEIKRADHEVMSWPEMADSFLKKYW